MANFNIPLSKSLAAALLLLAAGSCFAQGKKGGKLVDRRDQAEGWYVPVQGEVTLNGQETAEASLVLFRDNEQLGTLQTDKKGRFTLELDINQFYTVQVKREGYQDKMLYIDTKLPENVVDYPDYLCFVNLQPLSTQGIDPFYTDFPSAIVRWNEEEGGFYHSEHYLDHIQTRLAGVATATF
ncbi:MAG: hypothetical protein H6591_13325 [Flavobacteriales bacterium]|nr:hypothetical protein [Flavobacteriales bacterium]